MADLPQDVQAVVAQRSERRVIWQLAGCGGCVGLIGLLFGLLVYAMVAADSVSQRDPASAEASLQQIVACTLPEGYRGFRGIAREGRRIVLVTPHTHSGLKVPLTGRLALSVWTFKEGKADLTEVQAYWESKLKEEWFDEALAPESEESLTLKARGVPCQARVLTYQGGLREPKTVRVRLVLLSLPRHVGQPEQIAVGAIGGEERFDQAALDAFLSSLK